MYTVPWALSAFARDYDLRNPFLKEFTPDTMDNFYF